MVSGVVQTLTFGALAVPFFLTCCYDVIHFLFHKNHIIIQVSDEAKTIFGPPQNHYNEGQYIIVVEYLSLFAALPG